MKTDVILVVRCPSCHGTQQLKASDGPHKDVPLCPKDGMPMVPWKASSHQKKPQQ